MVEAATTASSDSAGASGSMVAMMAAKERDYNYFSPHMTRKTFLEDEIKVDYDDDNSVYTGGAAAASTNASSIRHRTNKTAMQDDN